MTDSNLIQQYLSGDIGAFNLLVWRWEKPIYNFILRNMGNTETTKDICQATFIKTFRELKRLREPDKFSPWIYRIALNLCRDEMKKKKNRHMVYLDEFMPDDPSPNSISTLPDDGSKSPEELVHENQVSAILKKALQALPEEQRVIIVMKQYQGLKFTEIAEILKTPINTIKSRLYYGLRALRKILEDSETGKEVLFNEM